MNYVPHSIDFLNNYCVLDLETTGLKASQCEIIEVGILKVRNGIVVEQMQTLIQPKNLPIPEKISQLTSIENKMLYTAPYLQEVAPWIWDFVGHDVIIGYNIPFDLSFLKEHCPCWHSINFIDVLPLARKAFPSQRSYSLTNMAKLLPLRQNTHRALADCFATYDLYEIIKQTL